MWAIKSDLEIEEIRPKLHSKNMRKMRWGTFLRRICWVFQSSILSKKHTSIDFGTKKNWENLSEKVF